ncbi:BQ5605_C024g09871 [Microbotryum silenes-dioicae]|uniref:BQ5605_C024g09871 protein n=1 Tax=Microbotryum silenes-dioicae TaxID=796604 RepID=A0A2X0PLC0_9BASI|nr:BQ5605_C024g09871 [Microbotryum silenes-dioicae]
MQAQSSSSSSRRHPMFVPGFINTLRHPEERQFATEWHELEQLVLHTNPDGDGGDGSDVEQPLHDARSTVPPQLPEQAPANARVGTTFRPPSSPPAKRRKVDRGITAELKSDRHQPVSPSGERGLAETSKPQLAPPVPKSSQTSDEASTSTKGRLFNTKTTNMSLPKRLSRQLAAASVASEASTSGEPLVRAPGANPTDASDSGSAPRPAPATGTPQLRRRGAHQSIPPPPPPPRPPQAPCSAQPPEPLPKKKGAKAKPRPSLEQAHTNTLKISDHQKLAKRFPTITDYLDYLEEHDLMKPGDQPLLGCRIAFVNPYPASGASSRGLRNRIDMQLQRWMGRVRIQGATLVRPEHFVASPRDAPLIESEESRALAARYGWTTHVIPLYLSGRGEVTFQSVLAMLGPSGVAIEELGPVVKVVGNDWIEQSIKAGRPLPYWDRFHVGDTRPVVWSDTRAIVPLRRSEAETGALPRRGEDSAAAPEQVEEIEDDDVGLDTGGRGSNRTHDEDQGAGDQCRRATSPLNESDFPAGDLSINTSDPIIAADLTIRGSPRPDSPRALLVAAKKAGRRK